MKITDNKKQRTRCIFITKIQDKFWQMIWVLLLIKMVSVGQKLSMTVNRVENKVVCSSHEIAEAKAAMR
jgi:hypothetical protein